jgi:hypothetical protein
MPATSSNVILIVAGSIRRAFVRPKLLSAPMPPPDFAARRMKNTSRPTISRVGPNPSRINGATDVVRTVVCALI